MKVNITPELKERGKYCRNDERIFGGTEPVFRKTQDECNHLCLEHEWCTNFFYSNDGGGECIITGPGCELEPSAKWDYYASINFRDHE